MALPSLRRGSTSGEMGTECEAEQSVNVMTLLARVSSWPPTSLTRLIALQVSVYLAKKTPSPKDSPALFLAKKLGGYAPSPISVLQIFGRAIVPEAAYGMYRTLIDAFLYATMKKEKVFAQAESFSDVYLAKTALPFQPPVMAFSPAATLTEDQANAFLKSLPKDSSMKVIGKSFEYVVPNVPITDLPKYIAAASPLYNCGSERITPGGMKAYLKTISIIELFLATNTYPAFKDLVTEIPQGQPMTFSVTGNTGPKGTSYFYSYVDDKKRDEPDIADFHSVLKRRKIGKAGTSAASAAGDDAPMEVEPEVVLGAEKNARFTVQNPPLDTSVIMAKPSGMNSSINIGPPGSVPALPGRAYRLGMHLAELPTRSSFPIL